MNTPCPSYRFRDFDFLDDTVDVIQPERSDPTDILCPVQIHVEPNAENINVVGSGTSTGNIPEIERDLLDLDSDDDHIQAKSYILIGDCQSNDTTPKKIPYPDANSHSNYNLLTEDTRSFESWSRNLLSSYPIANSHINVFQDTNSHSKYDVFSDCNSDKNGGISYDDGSSYSMANSHGIYRLLSDSSDRTGENLSRENLISPDEANYEIANSHSNYQIFYNSQTQYDIDIEGVRKGFSRRSPMTVEDYERLQQMVGPWTKRADPGTTSPVSESSHSSKSTEETSTTCDIEECLIQIEESLLNIEQNLLHVQDLDIPELKNLLYKSPSIERSLFEVQDLLCSGNIESVKRGTLFSLCNNYDKEELTEKSSSKEDSSNSNHDTFTNDENLLQFTDDRSTSEENSANVTHATSKSIFYGSVDRNVNFIPNSLGKTPTTKAGFDEIEDNIKVYHTNDKCDHNDDLTIRYNLNIEDAEKKLMNRKKCYSRTNSLDDNSIFQSTDFSKPRKTSLENLFFEANETYLEINGKAKSEDTLEQYDNKASFERKRKSSEHPRKRSKEGDRMVEDETKAEEFRKKIENIISSRRSALPNLENQVKTTKNSKEPLENRSNSLERSPKPRKGSADKLYDKDSPTSKAFKSSSYEKRKRKKPNRTQSSENALVPSKLISLSLSLLLAALLQAVRCLTDLVEDAFRSVSYDRSGLLE